MKLRWGYVSREPQKRLTKKSAFLRKLERQQKPAPIDTHWYSGQPSVTMLNPKHSRRRS